MSSYHECPRCGHKPYGISVAYMNIYKCAKCGEKFCHECSGTNGGSKCPECGSHSKSTVGEVYAK